MQKTVKNTLTLAPILAVAITIGYFYGASWPVTVDLVTPTPASAAAKPASASETPTLSCEWEPYIAPKAVNSASQDNWFSINYRYPKDEDPSKLHYYAFQTTKPIKLESLTVTDIETLAQPLTSITTGANDKASGAPAHYKVPTEPKKGWQLYFTALHDEVAAMEKYAVRPNVKPSTGENKGTGTDFAPKRIVKDGIPFCEPLPLE